MTKPTLNKVINDLREGLKKAQQAEKNGWAAHYTHMRITRECAEVIVEALDRAKKTTPVCPDCGTQMAKATYKRQDGSWDLRWICECKAKTDVGRHHDSN